VTGAADGALEPLRFSFVRGGPLFRAQQALGLMPGGTLGIGRRIAAVIAVTWLPIVLLAWLDGRVLEDGVTREPLLRHFGIHARFLLALPAFIVAEAVLEGAAFALIPHFETSGLVDYTLRAPFRDALRGVERLRDSRLVAAIIVGLVVLNAVVNWSESLHLDETSWALVADGGPGLTIAGWWYLGVARPVFALMLFLWVFRLWLVGSLCRRVAHLDLRLVPTHPDRAGGLGFIELLPVAFAPVAFGASAVLASRWGHDVVYHGTHVDDLRMPVAVFVVIALLAFLSPLAPFSGMLRRLKRRARLQYGSLFAHHGRMVHQRWILKQPVPDHALLAAPELGPVADVIAAYAAIDAIRPAPLRRAPLVALVAALALPLLAMAAIEVPVMQLLTTIGKALV
jgi:hypothetical protein